MIPIQDVKQALINSRGLVSPAARQLGISRVALQKRIKNNKSLQNIKYSAKEELKDFAESQLIKLIKKGDFRAVKYFLSTQAKDRDYIERSEVEQQNHIDFKNDPFKSIRENAGLK